MKLAFDKQSVRTTDIDGRLHISLTNISKANICPYLGSEIPNGEELGLDPKKVYQLLRDPKELEKAASTFNNLQLLYQHKPVHVTDPQKQITVGSTGTDAVFEFPYLKNSLVIWDAEAIATVEDDTQREISCAYHYIADMTPGTFEGKHFDGRMTEIEGNHVALVAEGRAGSDVIVGDSALYVPKKHAVNSDNGVGNILPEALKFRTLTKKASLVNGALMAALPASKLATDAKLDLDKLLVGVSNANWKDKKSVIVDTIKTKLAQDADIEDVIELLDKLDGESPVEAPAMADEPAEDDDSNVDGDETPEAEESEEAQLITQLKALIEKLSGIQPAEDEFPPKEDEEEMPDKKEKDDKSEKVGKPAMDAAIAAAEKRVEAATIARIRGVQVAEEEVKSYVGKLAVALDSADEVYKAALSVLGIDTKGIHPSAFRHILAAQPKPGSKREIAQDSVPVDGMADMFPDLHRLG